MSRKKKHPEHENLERWLVSYADFMTLLFATFTALYGMAQTDLAKLKDLSSAISQGFEQQSLLHGIQTIFQGKGVSSNNPSLLQSKKGGGQGVVGKFESMMYRPGEVKGLEDNAKGMAQTVDEINQEIDQINNQKTLFQPIPDLNKDKNPSANGSSGVNSLGIDLKNDPVPLLPVQESVQERGIRISMDSRLLFPPGNASLEPAGRHFLDKVAVRLAKFSNNMIHIEGHTDSQPISSAVYPSNWELSAARSSSIIRYLIGSCNMNPQSLVAVGYGDTQPIANNATPEGRARNRRVDIIIYSQKMSELENPRAQFLHESTITGDQSHIPMPPQATMPSPPPASAPEHAGSPPAEKPSSPPPEKPVPTYKPAPPPPHPSGPIHVIIRDKDGSEHVFIPPTRPVKPAVNPPSSSNTVLPKQKPAGHHPDSQIPPVPKSH